MANHTHFMFMYVWLVVLPLTCLCLINLVQDMATAGLRKFRLALIQLAVGADKKVNLKRAEGLVREAAGKGARVISLPECFNSPYGTSYFPEYAEAIPGDVTSNLLSTLARDCKIYLIGGSIPERDGEKLYNTCAVFGPQGNMLGKYRKMHLFDIDIPGKIRFQESETLTGGNELLTFDTEWCKIGIGICYDLRFPELTSLYAQRGVNLLVYPGAFNTVTGPMHWELLIRANALQNQLYMAAVCPARDDTATYNAHGHTTVSDPSGKVIATTEEKEAIVYGDIDLDYLDECRAGIPVSTQKRYDVYTPVTELK